MGRNIVIAIVVILLVVGGVYFYRNYKAGKMLDSGAVVCQGCMNPDQKARFDRENSGDAPDGTLDHRTDLSRTLSNDPTSSQPVSYPPASADASANPPGFPPAVATPIHQPAMAMGAGMSRAGAPPAGDTIQPNPPNGIVFAGTGSYQWYRQGNLTWRVNTATGSSCIVYATLKEWRKPIVMQHGCGSNA